MGKSRKALRVSPVRSLEILKFFAAKMVAQIGQFLVSRSHQTNRKMQQGAQQHVLLVDVCLETHPCPTQAHEEISVSVEVVLSLEYVLISDGEHNIKHNQKDSTSRVSSNLPTLPNLQPHHPCPSQQEPTHPLGLTCHTDHIGQLDHVELGGGILLANSPSWYLAHNLQQDFFGQFPLVCLTCLRGGTATPTPPARSHPTLDRDGAVMSWAAPADGRHCVPTWSAPDECVDAIVLVADILLAVVDREVESSSGEARDGFTCIVGDFQRVSFQQPVQPTRRAQGPRLCRRSHHPPQ